MSSSLRPWGCNALISSSVIKPPYVMLTFKNSTKFERMYACTLETKKPNIKFYYLVLLGPILSATVNERFSPSFKLTFVSIIFLDVSDELTTNCNYFEMGSL